MRKIFVLAVAAVALAGCNKWLDVDPGDKVLETEAFKTESGIDNVLNGLYLTMVGDELYGSNLTKGTVDFLAHYYAFPATANDLANRTPLNDIYQLGHYNYTSDYGNATKKGYIEPMWTNGYKFILAVNTFIKNVEPIVDTDILSEDRRKMYLGEAYGLRAMMHLDIYRLFGPVSPTGEAKVMPYHTNAMVETPDYVTAGKFLENVLADLTKASDLMVNTDPASKDLTVYDHHGDDDGLDPEDKFAKCFRNKRMNYWAVQALKARTNMLLGTTAGYNEVVAITSRILADAVQPNYVWNETEMNKKSKPFAWNAIGNGGGGSNYIFYDEVMFGPINVGMFTSWNKNFTMSLANSDSRGVALSVLIGEIFGGVTTVQSSDVRSSWWIVTPYAAGQLGVNENYYRNTKFSGMGLSGINDQIKPGFKINNTQSLIRLSEMVYMQAEAQIKLGHPELAIPLINNVLLMRGVPSAGSSYSATQQLPLSATEDEIWDMLRREYYREFVHEGQAWYLLKRNNMDKIFKGYEGRSSNVADGDMTMDKTKYVLPRPDDEMTFYPELSAN